MKDYKNNKDGIYNKLEKENINTLSKKYEKFTIDVLQDFIKEISERKHTNNSKLELVCNIPMLKSLSDNMFLGIYNSYILLVNADTEKYIKKRFNKLNK